MNLFFIMNLYFSFRRGVFKFENISFFEKKECDGLSMPKKEYNKNLKKKKNEHLEKDCYRS